MVVVIFSDLRDNFKNERPYFIFLYRIYIKIYFCAIYSELIAKLLAPITAKRIKEMEHFKPLAGFNPILYWKRISVPVFFGFGENDKNVPVDNCIERLKENNLNNFQIRSYPNGGHAIIDIHTERMSQKYLDDLVEFIRGVE